MDSFKLYFHRPTFVYTPGRHNIGSPSIIPELLDCRMDLLAKEIATDQIICNDTYIFKDTVLGMDTVKCSGN